MLAVGHFRGGGILLGLLVIIGVGFVFLRVRGGRTHHEDAPWPSTTPTRDDRDATNEPEPPPTAEGAGPTEAFQVTPARDSLPPSEAGDDRHPRRTRSASGPGASDGWAVETHHLTKRFGPNVAVDDVELLVPRGCAFGYLGPNGAGKTTLIRTLLGLTRADQGTMSLLGQPVPAERRQALARVGAIVDEPRFHGHLTGRENLRILAAARGGGATERIGPALARVGLTGRANDKVRSYSMGMRQRLGVAACLIGDPELLILDEPMNGLDPAGMHEMRNMIESLVDEGRTVVLSSHLLDEIERTCDAVAIVDRGRVIQQGPLDELIQGAGAVMVQVSCADPSGAQRIIEASGLTQGSTTTDSGLTVTLRPGSSRASIAEINRILVSNGVAVYGLQETRKSLEDWFLTVTSRLGES